MKKIHLKHILLFSLMVSMLLNPMNVSAALLKKGSKNQEVKQVQTVLKKLGFFTYSKATGYYGNITVNAVKKFQRKNGLAADGIIGKKTRTELAKYVHNQDTKAEKKKATAKNQTLVTLAAESSTKLSGALDWYKEVQYIWKKGINATVTDVNTGKSFRVKRTYGHNHADVEPLTKKDSKVIKEIWNGWSWERRAVVVEVDNTVLAGSMTAMPHAGRDSSPANKTINNRSGNYGRGVNLDAVKRNGANGVMDIHFLNSRTHSSNRVLKNQQDMVKKANSFIKKLL